MTNIPLRNLGETTRILRGQWQQPLAWLLMPAVILLLAACSQELIRDHKVTSVPTSPQATVAPVATQPAAPQAVEATAVPEAPPAAATGGGGTDSVAQGQELFMGKGTCLACHTIEGIAAGLVV